MTFPNVKAPRTPNFNPPDEHQRGHGGWVKNLVRMSKQAVDFADFVFRTRTQALQGIDELVEDHRAPAGKSLFYNEDANLPFVVRGPGVPANVKSRLPSLHLDLAPTFLEIAGVDESDFPAFFDGRSLLSQWHNPTSSTGAAAGLGNSKESINIEYWGNAGIEAPSGGINGSPFKDTTYKTIRVLGDTQSWVHTVWCNGDVELYDTAADPWELVNLLHVSRDNTTVERVTSRLNALLMVTKSCETDSCRDPWSFIPPPAGDGTSSILASLAQAMDPRFDGFFAQFDRVSFDKCMEIQNDMNEAPHFPPLEGRPEGGLGRAWRGPTDRIKPAGGVRAMRTAELYGTADQRHGTLEEQIERASRALNDAELGLRRHPMHFGEFENAEGVQQGLGEL